jgi:hypothetical protein
MLKLSQRIDNRIAYAVIAAASCIAIAVPALAGSVYSWRTLDGSRAFTDDAKRIPARYRDAAERQTLRHLEDYSRYTPSQVGSKEPYAERLNRRLEQLREATAAPEEVVATAPEGLRLGVPAGTGRYGQSEQISLPLAGEDGDPIVIESVRLRHDPGHITSRHATVIRQGDRIISVRKNERNDTAPREWPPDPAPVSALPSVESDRAPRHPDHATP